MWENTALRYQAIPSLPLIIELEHPKKNSHKVVVAWGLQLY